MTVKTFSANTMRHAISMVKKELGEDALILSTRRIPRSGNDPYREDIFQIEAMPPDKKEDEEPVFEDMLRDKDEEEELRGTGWEILQKELGTIRQVLCSSNYNDNFSELMNTHPGLFSIYARLVKSGISEKRVQKILGESFSYGKASFSVQSDYTRQVYRCLVSLLETVPPFYADKKEPEIIAFVGPTGAGKTTTIAKLAAKLHLEMKKRTGLISIDNYRIGAFDQLKTYSSIIGIPCIPAFTKKDMVNALNKLSGMDFILVDTAGQSHLDKKRLSGLRSIITPDSGINIQLVISAATARMDMKEVVESFSMLKPSGYIFTKIDETRRRGGIIDQVSEYRMPVSFITNGQEVPDDIIVATEKRILQLIMNPDAA